MKSALSKKILLNSSGVFLVLLGLTGCLQLPVEELEPSPSIAPASGASPTPRPTGAVSPTPTPTRAPTVTPSPVPTGTPGVCVPETARYYLAPNGNDSTGDGSIARPFKSLKKLWSMPLQAGDLVYLRGGTYSLNEQQYLQSKNGVAGNLIRIWAYPCDSLSPNFTRGPNYPNDNSTTELIYFEGEYIHFKGIEISYFRHFWYDSSGNPFAGWTAFRSGHSRGCIYEQIKYHHNGGGMVIRGTNSTDNLFLNSDFYANADPESWPGKDPYDGADGISVAFIGPNAVNTIRGCRAWYNADDGFDTWENSGHIIIENSWAFYNGYIEGGFNEAGNGSGFKLGSYSGGQSSKLIRTLKNNIAYKNRLWGFVENNAVAVHLLYNNTAAENGGLNFWFGSWGESKATVKNNISYLGGNLFDASNSVLFSNSSTVDHNSWDTPQVSVTNADFKSMDASQLLRSRKTDGSLPDIDFLKLAPGSDLINKGVSVGIPYSGSAPDLGAFESP